MTESEQLRSCASQSQIDGQNAVCNGLGHPYTFLTVILTRKSGFALACKDNMHTDPDVEE